MDYDSGSWWEREIDYMEKHLTPEEVASEANRILMDRDQHEAIGKELAGCWEDR